MLGGQRCWRGRPAARAALTYGKSASAAVTCRRMLGVAPRCRALCDGRHAVSELPGPHFDPPVPLQGAVPLNNSSASPREGRSRLALRDERVTIAGTDRRRVRFRMRAPEKVELDAAYKFFERVRVDLGVIGLSSPTRSFTGFVRHC